MTTKASELTPAQDRLLMALHGLVPIVLLEHIGNGATEPQDLFPPQAQREAWQENLVVPDALAGGGSSARDHKERAKSLTCLARAIVGLSCAPGGVPFLGRRWVATKTQAGMLTIQERPINLSDWPTPT